MQNCRGDNNSHTHKYLGPGNKLQSGTSLDTDDSIAEKHDILYTLNPSNVEKADEIAVDEFLSDFSNTYNYHSLIGGLGLQLKRNYESVFGQQYPMSKHHAGQSDYAYAQKRLSEIYKEEKQKNKDLSWWEFQKLHGAALMKEAQQQRLANGSSNRIVSTTNLKRNAESNTNTDTSEKRSRTHDTTQPSTSNTSDIDLDNNSINSSNSNMDIDSMETIANPSKGGGVTSGASGSGGKGGTSSGAINGPVMIYKNPATPYITRTYRKNWIIFSYGFAHSLLKGEDNYMFTTPLALIPVDYLPFYVNNAEFLLMYGKNVAVHCRARVKPLGCRMNFQTSATDSKWATSEFVAIGQSAVGLNLCIPGKNRKYTPKSKNPMEVESTSYPSMTDLGEKMYGGFPVGTWQGAANCVPRHLNLYYTPMLAKDTQPQTQDKFTHINGSPKIGSYVDRFLVNTCIGQPIVNYEYFPKNGILTDTYNVDVTNIKQKYRIKDDATVIKLSQKKLNNVVLEGNFVQQTTDDTNINEWETAMTSNWHQQIEHHDTFTWDSGHVTGVCQPQVHVGITAVPAINPGSETVDFQNTSIYWSIETELTVHQYQNSCFEYGVAHTYNPTLYPKGYIKKYWSGNTFSHHPNLHEDEHYSVMSDAFTDTSNSMGPTVLRSPLTYQRQEKAATLEPHGDVATEEIISPDERFDRSTPIPIPIDGNIIDERRSSGGPIRHIRRGGLHGTGHTFSRPFTTLE
ncbi:uncharacterized protein LOC105827867 isoform X2 [Monomorium pharaonis]|uniref:uncharacterized protein LOC105827867 isoform X1 n=1 Tax=Monomorium pharaonis TaxID=307658 RepID=UPI00063F37FA|nr:uncharacterized protein LOC105827867 isoform X1 [Monomorium pharaonis]XP_012521508.1 uncharacterized protein LOC105827867 isoform X3 [Monomorium pharaonis]XP_012521509.1 uncharacterized protein LOC105827867 isoform X2 [Monomorium pharaonis]